MTDEQEGGAASPPEGDGMREGKNGGRLKTGGVNPGSGRPPTRFRRSMVEALLEPEVHNYLLRSLRGEFGPKMQLNAHKHAAERAFGRPHQHLTVNAIDLAEGWTWDGVLALLSEQELAAVLASKDPFGVAAKFRPECFGLGSLIGFEDGEDGEDVAYGEDG